MSKNTLQAVGILFLVMMLPVLVIGIRFATDFRSSASPGEEPKELVVSNLTDTSATISWITADKVAGLVNYGPSESALNTVAKDIRDSSTASSSFNTHYVTIRNLSPSTTYYFEITSGSAKIKESGYSFKTLTPSDSLATPESIIGSVSSSVNEGILYAHASNGIENSTTVSIQLSSSNFALVKQNFKNSTTGEPFDLDSSRIIISVTNADSSRGQSTINGTDNRTSAINLSTNSSEYNPQQILSAAGVSTPTPTLIQTTPIPTTPFTTSQPTTTGSVNTASLVTTKVSYGQELTNAEVPYAIFISDISSTGFCVNWLTKQPTTGKVVYTRSSSSVSKEAKDARDPANSYSDRYTHRACVLESNFTASERVSFFINAVNINYGLSLSSSPFVFQIPQSTSSPPSPGSIEGTLQLQYTTLNTGKGDFLISARYDSATNKSTWVSTTTPVASTNWTLPYTSILDSSLSSFFTASSGTPYAIEVNGEYNSTSLFNASSNQGVISIPVQVGLSIISPRQNSKQLSSTLFSGTAAPNTVVNLTVNNSQLTVTSNSQGQWNSTVQITGAYGKVNARAQTSSGQVTGIQFESGSSNLPATAIEVAKTYPYILGIILIFMGIILKFTIERKRIKSKV